MTVAPRLIPRSVLFGSADIARPRLSPDARWISYLAPVDGVANLHVAERLHPADARPLTFDGRRGIREYEWASDSRHLIALRDRAGDENFQAFAIDTLTGQERNLTPEPGVRARILGLSPRHASSAVFALNDRDRRFHDPVLIDIESGRRRRLAQNERGFVEYLLGPDLEPAYALRLTAEGGLEVWDLADPGLPVPVISFEAEDLLVSRPVAVGADGRTLYLLDSRGRDTAAVVEWTPGSAQTRVLAVDERCDFRELLLHPTLRTPEVALTEYERRSWRVLDVELISEFQELERHLPGGFEVCSRSTDNRHWLLASKSDTWPERFFLYDRDLLQRGQLALRELYAARSALAQYPQARMHPVHVRARDGLDLVSYVSLPPETECVPACGRPRTPLPLVLIVHGGPWARDSFSNHPWHQWLTNRGYAVLSVNYRGSLGFGKRFVNAANGEWGGKMHDDLVDAVRWAVAAGVARPEAVAIMGASFGGYATLVALTRSPDVFACGIDIVGPSNLLTFLANAPPYWAAALPQLYVRVGDPRTENGRRLLESRSPLNEVDRICRPLLVAQGANDPRATRVEGDQIVEALRRRGVPVTYALYPDEGHGFGRPANSLSFHAIAEAFLSRHLGGRREPVGDALVRSSVELGAGSDWILEQHSPQP